MKQSLRMMLVLSVAWTAGRATLAEAQCSAPLLVSGTSQTAVGTPSTYTINQISQYWTAVGVRSGAGSDWNLTLYQDAVAFPTCVDVPLASSALASGVDFVVGDFNSGHNPLAVSYPRVTRASGAADGTVEWDAGANALTVNGPLLNRTTGATDVLEVWDVNLSAGHDYRIQFSRTGADVKVLLFKSGAGPYWVGRSAKLLEATGDVNYTPTSSGYFAIVVVNDNGAAGSYTLGVGECRAPDELLSGVSVSTSGAAERDYWFDQNATFFMAVGARGASNWDIEAFSAEGGSTYPNCLTGQLASSSLAAPTVDMVVANFNAQLIGNFFARVHLNQYQGSGSARVEWDSGSDFLVINGAPVDRTTDANDVLEVFDAHFTSGTTYQVLFNTTGADLRLLVFGPATTWAGRSAAVLSRSGSPNYQSYVPNATGWHGLVVVNENGAAGGYQLRINQGVVGVGDVVEGPPTALEGMHPNPARGPAGIHFALHHEARVSFQVLDVQGRVVSETQERDWGPGRWTAAWDGKSRGGGRLSAGVYFLRMRVQGQPVALKKFALLD